MQLPSMSLILIATAVTVSACAANSPSIATPQPEHRHEQHLPPVGRRVSISLDGKTVEVALANVPHSGASALLPQVLKVAFPAEDTTLLHFDFIGSDGFHPASRPACTRLLTGAEMASARIDVVTHDVSFDDVARLPGCYRVKAVVRIEASR
ncbi:MAG TPA: hypothetical protein VK636_10220 [Gemmatimonadaceae bacterium]|nr:hypothetical protein [Gemmatimonadaceae bacterium]